MSRRPRPADGPGGPAGPTDVMLARHRVGPHRRTEQSVFLRLDADQGEHIRPANSVQPWWGDVPWTQPVADGPAGPDRSRSPVGTADIHGVHDDVRPTACGPVCRKADTGPPKYSKMSSPDDSYQPLVTDPLGTNEMNAIHDPDRPMAGGPRGRPFSLDPMGPTAMLSLGDGNQPASVIPSGQTVDT